MMHQQTYEPIAVIGMGCRFPGGVTGADSYWQLLTEGVDAITEIPEDRWRIEAFYDSSPRCAGRTYGRWGGFVQDIDQFEPACFHISPREAVTMDPQQRMLLEVTWEALDDAGLAVERLAGSRTGVFVGVSTLDYLALQGSFTNFRSYDSMTGSGTALSIAANRLSFCFDLRGPSVAVDTACSSSLAAVDYALRNIYDGKCDMAIVGGVNALLLPHSFVSLSAASMLSPSGRCRAFDAGADGFVRAEGAGAVILKPLSKALADGDAVHALLLGSALNQDGRTGGISLPNVDAQEAMLREIYGELGVEPVSVPYVEAHGTGTAVGDPAEAHALGRAFGPGRSFHGSLRIGSVKTNIGHLEAASGLASIIKAVLVLKHGMIPPSLHFSQPNPNIPFEELRLRVVTQAEPLTRDNGPAIVGVNSFGFGGTNGHAVLSAFNSDATVEPVRGEANGGGAHLFTLTARNREVLPILAELYVSLLTDDVTDASALAEVCYSLNLRKSHHAHRLSFPVRAKEEAVETLRTIAAGEACAGVRTGESARDLPKLAFVFSGQGPQWWGMGRELLQTEGAFKETLEACHELVKRHGNWSLLDEMRVDESKSRMRDANVAQPALFALQVGVARLWASWGIRPDAVVGHSVGEIAAAHISGALSLDDAVRVVVHREGCMDRIPATGGMLAAGIPPERVGEYIEQSEISLSAVNSPNLVTLSGDLSSLKEVAQRLEQEGVFHKFLRVKRAFHCAAMDPIRDELLPLIEGIQPQASTIPMISTVTGDVVNGCALTADYWWNNVRQPVQFADAITWLVQNQYGTFIEVAPHPVLSGAVLQCCSAAGKSATTLPSLRREDDEQFCMLRSLGALFNMGYPIAWDGLWETPRRCVRLPRHPWLRESFWSECPDIRRTRLPEDWHPLLGHSVRGADPAWEEHLDIRRHAYLQEHRVNGNVIFPAAAFVEMGLAAVRITTGTADGVLENVHLQRALFLAEDVVPILQVRARPEEATLAFHSSLSGDRGTWSQHCIASWCPTKSNEMPPSLDVKTVQKRLKDIVSGEDCYVAFEALGLDYGPAFRGLSKVWRKDGESLGRIKAPEVLQGKTSGYAFHPALLDACLQVVGAAVRADIAVGLMMPARIARVRFLGSPTDRMWSHVVLTKSSALMLEADINIYADDGTMLLTIHGLRLQRVYLASGHTRTNPVELLYEFNWYNKPLLDGMTRPRSATYLPCTEELATAALRHADHVIRAHDPQNLAWRDPQQGVLVRAYLVRALRQLGIRLQQGDEIVLDTVMDNAKIKPEHRRIVRRYLRHLEACGTLNASKADHWIVRETPPDTEPAVIWRDLLSRHPLEISELRLLELTGPYLAAILTGEVDVLTKLFPGGSIAPLESLYHDALVFRVENCLTQGVIERVVAQLPPGEALRILEVGGGTGGLTSHLLERLPARRTQYVFSDVSPMFLAKAEGKYYAFPFVTYQSFDIDQDPGDQGLALGSFDIILASDVLHAARDVAVTLRHLRGLLSANGLLVLNESQCATPIADFVFGLTEGWWSFTDYDKRPDYPLLSRDEWAALLEEVGYTDIRGLWASRSGVEPMHTVFLARVGDVAETGGIHDVKAAISESKPEDETYKRISSGHWLIFVDTGDVGERLAQHFEQKGGVCTLVRAGSGFSRIDNAHYTASSADPEDIRRVLDLFDGGGNGPGLAGVVHLWSLDSAPPDRMTLSGLLEAEQRGCHVIMHLMQALSSRHDNVPVPLVLVTAGAQDIGLKSGQLSIGQSPLLGLARIFKNESPRQLVKMVDLLPDPSDLDIDGLFREIQANDCEEEVVWRAGNRFVPRLERALAEVLGPVSDSNERQDTLSFHLTPRRPGALESLEFREGERRDPGPGEVEIGVHTTALNLRDVMRALGLYEVDEEQHLLLGDECAGTVTRVGPGVTRFQVGDRVFGQSLGSLGSHTLAFADFLIAIPVDLNEYEAVTMPVAFHTAYSALHILTSIQQGDSVLIHSAAGGVGLAALQLAQRAGAVVFATAGTEEKRALLTRLGAPYVMDSRSLTFADEIMGVTQGRGVDIVLNSLAGQGLVKSLSCLASGGHFVELGKRDFYQNSAIGLWPFRKNITFHAFDLIQLLLTQPALARRIPGELERMLANGSFRPLTGRIVEASRVAEAFRFMGQGRHTGKIVIDMRDSNLKVVRPQRNALRFDPEATYLITGGFGGFGLALAKHIIIRGGRHLVLLSPRGPSTEERRQAVRDLEQAGANVFAPACDVAEPEQLQRVTDQVRSTMPPLKGVFHTAMVLDDCTLLQLDARRFHNVMRPKVSGAWNLHTCTRDCRLDYFVLFSSASAVMGNPGQSNYSAANVFLEAFAAYRQSVGLAATAVGWGMLGEVGYMARHEDLSAFVARRGVQRITPDEALAALEEALRRGAPRMVAGRFDWGLLGSFFTPDRESDNLITELAKSGVGKQRNSDARNKLGEMILGAEPDERQPIADQYVRERVAQVLKTAGDRIDSRARLSELGLDSLMVIELVNLIEGDLGITLPLGQLTQDTSLQALATALVELLGGGTGGDRVGKFESQSKEKPDAPACLFPLQDGDGQVPLFCFHDAAGDVAVYLPLVKLLPENMPLWGLQSRSLTDAREAHTSFAEMSNDYVDAITHVQPTGPYRLLGFSVGGLVAVHTAAELERRGHTVEFAGLIEPVFQRGGGDKSRREYLAQFIRASYDLLHYQLGLVKKVPLDRLLDDALRIADTLLNEETGKSGQVVAEWLEQDGQMRVDIASGRAREYVTRLETHITLLAKDPEPPTVEAVLDVWTARDSFLQAVRTDVNDGRVRIHKPLEGDHFSVMIAPQVSILAEDLTAAIFECGPAFAAK